MVYLAAGIGLLIGLIVGAGIMAAFAIKRISDLQFKMAMLKDRLRKNSRIKSKIRAGEPLRIKP